MKGAGCSIITSRLGIRWFCTFLVILGDGKVGGGGVVRISITCCHGKKSFY